MKKIFVIKKGRSWNAWLGNKIWEKLLDDDNKALSTLKITVEW